MIVDLNQIVSQVLLNSSFSVTISDLSQPDEPLIYVNDRFCQMTGYSREEVLGRNCRFLQGAEYDQPDRAKIRTAIAERRAVHARLKNFRKDGTLFWNRILLFPATNTAMGLNYYVGIQEDVTASVTLLEKLHSVQSRVRLAQSLAKSSLFEINLTDQTVLVSRPDDGLTLPQNLVMEPRVSLAAWLEGVVPEDRGYVEQTIQSCQLLSGDLDIEFRLRQQGSTRWVHWRGDTLMDESGQIILGLSHDITERQEYRERLIYAASHDALTGLPNRSALMEHLEQALHVAERNRQHVAVLFFDLDGFKLVNDTYGHEVGDQLLKQAAQHWRATLRQSDFLARQSGDEFVVVLTDFLGVEQIEVVAQKLIDVLRKQELSMADGSLRVEASVGISVSLSKGGNPHELLQQADTAMYAAKKNGGDQYRFFDQGMALKSQSRIQTMSGLRQALINKGLTVAYQPIYQTISGKLLGMEALLRWEHSSQGLLSAGSFLPQVSQPTLLIELNQWVMQNAARQFAAWRKQGLPTGWLSLNVFPAHLRQAAFREMLIGLLEQYDLEPGQIVLEITEETFFSAEAADLETMQQLVALGVRFAIDDFGTGYSNLSYLQQLPVDIIKIDRIFTQKLPFEQGKAIIRGLNSIAHNLGLQTICEGVETDEQLAFVQTEGCDMVQGYRLSQPLLEEGMLELLRLPK